MQITDHTADAEALFRDFAARHLFSIERIGTPHVELLMRLPAQPGLSFELTLGLQNVDELNIGFGGLWSYFFPFDKTRSLVTSLLDAIASGDCRLVTHRQFGAVVRRVLEKRSNNSWQAVYTEVSRPRLPFVETKTSYLYNVDARIVR